MFLLDTNALIAALVSPENLGSKTKRILQHESTVLFSSISLVEIQIKAMLGKLNLDLDFLDLSLRTGFEELPFFAEASQEISRFTSLAKHDPFDRMLLASASHQRAKLVTSDQKLLNLGLDWVVDSRL